MAPTSEKSGWSTLRDVAGFVGWAIGIGTFLMMLESRGREREAAARAERVDQREQKADVREREADERQKQADARDRETNKREKRIFEMAATASEHEKAIFEMQRTVHARELKALEQDEEYSYTISQSTLDDMSKSFSTCKPIHFRITNMSKNTVAPRIVVMSEGARLHSEIEPAALPIPGITNCLYLPVYTLSIDKSIEHTFRIHSSAENPKEVKIIIWINENKFGYFTFIWDKATKEYRIAKRQRLH